MQDFRTFWLQPRPPSLGHCRDYWTCLNRSTWLDYWSQSIFIIIIIILLLFFFFFFFWERGKCGFIAPKMTVRCWMYLLRRPPLHTCSSNKDPLSHNLLSQLWFLTRSQVCFLFLFYLLIFLDRMFTSKWQTPDSCSLWFELVILLFKSLLILFFANYNGGKCKLVHN